MIGLFRQTAVIREIAQTRDMARATLVLFPDEKYLRPYLLECAKAFFGAADGSREARLIEKESYLDCKLLPQAGGKLTAETVAFLSDDILLSPAEGARKLYVLDAFHTAAPLLQNKLLKMLEEPPRGVYFLLGACGEQSLLKTVLSRVSKLTVPLFSASEIEGALTRNYGSDAGIARAAAMCGGKYSVAERLLSESEDFRLAAEFLRGDAVAVCREVGDKKSQTFFPALRLLLRDVLFCKVGQERFCAMKREECRAIARRYSEEQLLNALEGVDAAEREVKFNTPLGQAAYTLWLRMGSGKADVR